MASIWIEDARPKNAHPITANGQRTQALSSIFGSVTAQRRATSIRHADRDVPTCIRVCAPNRDRRRLPPTPRSARRCRFSTALAPIHLRNPSKTHKSAEDISECCRYSSLKDERGGWAAGPEGSGPCSDTAGVRALRQSRLCITIAGLIAWAASAQAFAVKLTPLGLPVRWPKAHVGFVVDRTVDESVSGGARTKSECQRPKSSGASSRRRSISSRPHAAAPPTAADACASGAARSTASPKRSTGRSHRESTTTSTSRWPRCRPVPSRKRPPSSPYERRRERP